MSATIQSEQPEAAAASGEFEGEIREFIRKDAPWRRRPVQARTAAGGPATSSNSYTRWVP